MKPIKTYFCLISYSIINIIYFLTVFLIKISIFFQFNLATKPFSFIKKLTKFLTKISGMISFRTPLKIFSWFGNDIRLSVIEIIIRPYLLLLLDNIVNDSLLSKIKLKIKI